MKTLEEWRAKGRLVAHKTSAQEIGDLISAASRDLRDSRTPGLSADWKLSIAYNAALRIATAALAASGYRASRDRHHVTVIDSLEHTIGAEHDLTILFHQIRRKRNVGTYERPGEVSDHEAEEALGLAERIRDLVITWLKREHPELERGYEETGNKT